MTTHTHSHQHHEHNHEHSPDWAQWTRALLLLGLGLYFAITIATGNLTNYINERVSWLSYVAVVLFFILGGVAVYDLLRGGHHHEHDHDHQHSPLSWKAIAILAMPLVLGTLVPSQPLGANAVDGNLLTRSISLGSASNFTQNPLDRNILDWLRAFNASGTPAVFDGQPVDLVGFIYRESSYGENRFMVARFSISCCVADAFAMGIPVESTGSSAIPDGQWVRVKGVLQSGDFNGQNMPIIHATSVEEVEQPEHPYLYS